MRSSEVSPRKRNDRTIEAELRQVRKETERELEEINQVRRETESQVAEIMREVAKTAKEG